MQYELTLPADYDMRIIRDRVRINGHGLDHRAGLALKAYLIRSRGVDNSPVNQYAPFYLWNSTAAMAQFLIGGGGFQNIVRDFGRPPVSQWTGIASVRGHSTDHPPGAASRRLTSLASLSDAAGAIDDEVAALESLAGHPDLHTAALAFDPRDWRLLRFALWHDQVPDAEPTDEHYEVLHLSAPEINDLPPGRHW